MISADTRRTVRTIYAFSCGYCGVTETEVGSYLTIDHFQPLTSGGTDEISNLVYACFACNLHKSATWNPHTPVALHPFHNEMHLHISSLSDGTLQGLTPEGLLHIETLNLNRPPMIERRKMRFLLERVLEREANQIEQEKIVTKNTQKATNAIRRRGKRKPHSKSTGDFS